jgi:phosphoribosylaminoimidazolecarboxamide formyltransferase / IMP cyclohydrolase
MTEDFVKIRRALISVYDKTNIIPLAKVLRDFGCEIISTGGTAKILNEAGIETTKISKVTGNPEAFGGRMKTISFNIESSLLFDRQKDKDEAQKLNIKAIDLVVCNLYPFGEVLKAGANIDELIENIDIGGPTMIRAGAKNCKYVAVLTDPSDYPKTIDELKSKEGSLSIDTRKSLMCKAFNHTADYDSLIAQTMDRLNGSDSLRLSFKAGKKLRYGENSHQEALFYREADKTTSLYDLEVLHGKELSFNNILDINGAIESVRRLNDVSCAVVKHSNPCGLCQGKTQRDVFESAWAGDPISAFGSIIAFNTTLEKDTAKFLRLDDKDKTKRKFVEVIIAPDFKEDALTYLQQHKNLRIIKYDVNTEHQSDDLRYLNGSLLKQSLDTQLYSKLENVTDVTYDIEGNRDLIEFGLKAISSIKSNSIIVVRKHKGNLQLLGMGAGQPNRLISTKIALDKCSDNIVSAYKGDVANLSKHIKEETSKCLLVSDAFFPFSDNIIVADQYGIKSIIQPGGSIRDKSVINKCNECGISMIFTGTRHFKH